MQTASEAGHNTDIIRMQEHRYYYRGLDWRYHNTNDGRTFVPASAGKMFINTASEDVGMLLGLRILK